MWALKALKWVATGPIDMLKHGFGFGGAAIRTGILAGGVNVVGGALADARTGQPQNGAPAQPGVPANDLNPDGTEKNWVQKLGSGARNLWNDLSGKPRENGKPASSDLNPTAAAGYGALAGIAGLLGAFVFDATGPMIALTGVIAAAAGAGLGAVFAGPEAPATPAPAATPATPGGPQPAQGVAPQQQPAVAPAAPTPPAPPAVPAPTTSAAIGAGMIDNPVVVAPSTPINQAGIDANKKMGQGAGGPVA